VPIRNFEPNKKKRMSNNQISIDVSSNEKSSRIYAHTHVVGIGLNPDGSAKDIGKIK